MLSLGSVSRARGGGLGCDWVEPTLKPMRCGGACSRAGFETEGRQDEAGKIIPPGGRDWSGLARRGCHREGVVKRGGGGELAVA